MEIHDNSTNFYNHCTIVEGNVMGSAADENDDDVVSILADDAQRGLPEFEIAQDHEERLNSLLPPLHQIVVPVRRRAHTVDVECAAAAAVDDGADDDASLSSLDERPAAATFSSHLRLSLSEEGRRRRRRKRLLNSRCVRGFAALCVYGIMVLQPSTQDLMETAVPRPFDARPPPIEMGPKANPAFPNATDSRVLAGTKATLQQKSNLAALPKFHRAAPHPKYHSTMPPNAIHSITRTNGTVTRWHKIPPDPPTIYHKKQRPILSHAHSYQLHQEPLVFGREQKTSFLLDDENSEDAHGRNDHPFWQLGIGDDWTNALIWLSLLGLLADTSYREWQHYRWQWGSHPSSGSHPPPPPPETISAMQRRQRRSLHYRRSPSPELRRRRFDSF